MSLNRRPGEGRLHPAWWTLMLVLVIVSAMTLSGLVYAGAFKQRIPVTVTADRTGLMMEPDSKVMLNGVQVGTVVDVGSGQEGARLKLELDADQARYIPANVGSRIRATTLFGSKFVDLVYPANPTAGRIAAGAVLKSSNVTTEVNTVFENLVGVLDQIDPSKLNAVLTALAEGFRGNGERIGQAITAGNQVLAELNPRSDTIGEDWRALTRFSDAYGNAADDIIAVLDNASTTATTVVDNASALDALLLNTIGFAQGGVDLIAPNQQNLADAINNLEPTTALLLKYSPMVTCTLLGVKWWLDRGGYKDNGGNGYSQQADAGLLLGDDAYRYPENLPIVAAKGGPGGKPGCGSLPDPSAMFPVRALVTNTGWGTGIGYRPNPGIGRNCWRNYLPVTRPVPEQPSSRQCLPGPAPGPVTAPGMPPYGAALYGPGGEPLWPGIPPAGTPPPVPVPGTPVAPGKIPPNPPPPAVFSAPPPPNQGGQGAPSP
jgi:phospholipid/cholesterol/gamma-HCH transport system substrate-binding protein